MIQTPGPTQQQSPTPVTTRLAAIRLATSGPDDRVEASVDLAACLTSRAAYAQLLTRYLALYDPLETLLATLTGPAAQLASTLYRPKAHLLRRDLQILATHPAAPTPTPPRFPALNHPDSLLGALYVIEGSSLGGRYIARDVHKTLALDATSGAAFFTGDGDATPAHWKLVTDTLNREVADPTLAAQSATILFHAFEHCLAPPPKDGQ
jgi:heme oxygenase